MKVSELGEFGLIDLLEKKIAESPAMQPPPGELIIGIGDDTAAWRGDDSVQLATVDSMVQDVHFSLETATWKEIGWKSLAINLSDIAAMGGIPDYALVALSMPENTAVEDVGALYEGMIELAGQSKVAIAGGNVSRSPVVSITVTVIGSSTGEILRRSTARVDKVKTGISCPVTVIGEITGGEPGEIDLLDAEGNPVKMNKSGWTHF